MATKVPASRSQKLRNESAKEWAIPGFDQPFVQDPLTFFEKNEFLALVAEALEDSLAGGADIDAVLALLGMSEDQLKKVMSGDMNDLRFLAQSLFNVVVRLIRRGPELMEDLYLIALSVPPIERSRVREHLRLIDDDTGFGILELFVDQNTTTIRDFLPRWRELLGSMVEKLREPEEDSSATSID